MMRSQNQQAAIKRRTMLQQIFAASLSVNLTGLGSVSVASGQGVQVPIRRDYGRRLIAQARFNGAGPFDFVVDTAASKSVIFHNLAVQGTIKPSDQAPEKIFGLTGVREAPVFHLGTITSGDIILEDHVAPVLPDWEEWARTPQGILGLDAFENKMLVLDFPNGYMAVEDPAGNFAKKIRSEWTVSALVENGFGITNRPLFLSEASIGRRPMPFLIDTGAADTICNAVAANFLRVFPRRNALTREAQVTDTHGKSIKTLELLSPSVKIGGKSWSHRNIYLTDAPFFEEIGYGDKPFGIMGLDHLSLQAMAIDLRAGELFLAP